MGTKATEQVGEQSKRWCQNGKRYAGRAHAPGQHWPYRNILAGTGRVTSLTRGLSIPPFVTVFLFPLTFIAFCT